MRPVVKKQIENRETPLVLAHMGGAAHGRENSIEAIQGALSYKPDIIEVDLRKSRDGVLYCHHGSIPFGYMVAHFYKYLPFTVIEFLARKRDTLAEIFEAIPDTTTVFLDLKDKHIDAADVQPFLKDRANVWIGVYSYERLRALRDVLGEEHVYVLNRLPILKKATERQQPEIADLHLFSWRRDGGVYASEGGATFLKHTLRYIFTLLGISDALRKRAGIESVALLYSDLSKAPTEKKT